MDHRERITHLLSKDRMLLLCELGKEVGVRTYVSARYHTDCASSHIKTRTLFPREYNAAYQWLEPHRKTLQKCVCEDWGFLSKKNEYPRGTEVDLILDLSTAIGKVLGAGVDPVLVATVLLRLGLDDFCSDYSRVDDLVRQAVAALSQGRYDDSTLAILAEALRINPANADANYYYGSILTHNGQWRIAIKYFETAIKCNPAHSFALNDLGYTLTAHDVDVDAGFDCAKQALGMTLRGSYEEPYVLDTVGWGYYVHDRNLAEAERHLRDAVRLPCQDKDGQIVHLYHLAVVLRETGQGEESKEVRDKLLTLNPSDAEARDAHRKAKEL